MDVLARPLDLDVRGPDAVALDARQREPEPVDARRGERLAHRRGVGTGIEQRAEQHVARRTPDAVDVEDHSAPPARRAIRAAIVPAPKPSSMLTTESAAAHELSIASSAATPLKAVP